MKITRAFMCLTMLSPMFMVEEVTPKRTLDKIVSDVYGPFEMVDTQWFDMLVKVQMLKSEPVHMFMEAATSDHLTKYVGDSRIGEKVPGGYRFKFHVPVGGLGFLGSDGVYITAKAYLCSDESLYESETIYLTPLIKKSISYEEYKDHDLVFENTMFSFNQSLLQKETISFLDTDTNITKDSYLYLDVSNVKFKVINPYNTCECKNASLIVKDPNNFFTAIRKDKNKEFVIPLDFAYLNEEVNLSFKNKFYYEESQSIVSLEEKEGFIKTDKFFLPKNKSQDLDSLSFEIRLEEVGAHKTDIVIPLTTNIKRNYFGKCDDSDFCIEGAIYA